MSFLRSCYSTQARFFNDSSDEYPIIWYWCEAGATRFLGRTSFTPLSFSQPGVIPDSFVGESPSASRPWRNGSIPVSAPTGVLDGNPIWFEKGQSVNDPGLERTSFGIPLNCSAPPYSICGSDSLNHYTWQIIYEGVPFGISAFENDNAALFTTTLFPGVVWTLGCSSLIKPDGGTYIGPVLFARQEPFFGTFYAPVQTDDTPTFLWTLFIGTTPPNPVSTRWLPGP